MHNRLTLIQSFINIKFGGLFNNLELIIKNVLILAIKKSN